MLLDKLDDILINIYRLRTYFIVKVWPIEGALKLLSIHNAQILLDIRTNLIRCRRCQSNNRRYTYLINDGTDTTIFRTEVMAPL